MERKRVGILIFPDVEVLDFCGPYEVFSVTHLNPARRREEPGPFDVLLVAENADPVATRGGMRVLPDVTTADCPPLDILVVPGGWGTRQAINNVPLLNWIEARGRQVETLTSVCTGSFLLAQAGLLNDRSVTTHWLSLDRLRETFPQLIVVTDQHVVQDEHILTSAGISAGIDMALHVVMRYHGAEVARTTAAQMEYPFPEDNRRRVQIDE